MITSKRISTIRVAFFAALFIFLGAMNLAAQDRVLVFAAASAANAIMEITEAYKKETGVKVTTSFAASSVLAKQIDSGAPAQVFLSANPKWMDYLIKKKKINQETQMDFLGNTLVVIAPKGKAFPLRMGKNVDFAATFSGKLAMGDPLHVPAGIYGKEALVSLGWWNSISPRVVGALDVRFAMNFVERGEANAGIVYATDARMSDKVEIVGSFPADSHEPITYPLALAPGAGKPSVRFFNFLISEKAKNIFTKYGFVVKN